MSNISGVGSTSAPLELRAPQRTAPAASTSSDGDQALEALQKMVSQIEGAANTKAIPAHQSW